MNEPAFSIGIEEEYLAVDPDTMDLAPVPPEMLEEAKDALGDKVSPEFRACQIEIGTGVCADIGEARSDLANLRCTLSEIAERHGRVLAAVSCHPFGEPENQETGPAARYDEIAEDIGGIARRLMTCGMHVHVGLGEDDELRADLMQQFTTFLPYVLALSASSPYWKGEDTRLESYRLNVFDSVPRSGLPPRFDHWSDYRRTVDLLVDNEIVEDASKIWWDLRPSEAFPTLEVRIADVCPRMEDALSIAAFIQSGMRLLWRLKTQSQRWRIYERFLIEENRWRAQRYGTNGTLLDLGRGHLSPFADMLEDLTGQMRADAEALGCADELNGCLDIARNGASATRQRKAFEAATNKGEAPKDALREVLREVTSEFRQGCSREDIARRAGSGAA
ncbi:carboxylate-amine ligase [Profundibacterium mesophilum]|uniref:Putative glutamate--cysteine ligase 2 n=1 Tax=Profundibacterium mesophilum KAUST100406-0324 TaxID=1037889 RepID=A0A921NPM3_9RHOB|nr:carboxylate-amine ligase [Profundibacterium mesophilum]KAF0674780.1 Carboxylate-amine ligase Rru [Profundibacterium mesophilum KAUST100406-0324]